MAKLSWAIPLALLSVCACATTGELRLQQPVVDQQSSRTPDAIVTCASDALSSRSVLFNVLPREAGSSVILGPTSDPDLVADVQLEGTTTRLRIYRQPRMYFGLSRAFINTILSCAGLPEQP